MAIGISIALISQTYNLGGNFDEFILTWSLLALPLTYLLEAIVPALFYLVGITVWVFNIIYHHMSFFYFLLLGAILPFLWWEINDKGRYHIRVILFLWILAITVPTAMCKIINIEPVPVWLSSLFVLFYIAGSRWWSEGLSKGGNSLKIVGLLVTIIFSFEMSDSDLWEYNKNLLYNGITFDTGLQLTVIILLNIIAIVLWIKCWSRREWEEIIIGVVPVLAIIGWAMAQEGLEATTAFLFSVYLFILGVGEEMVLTDEFSDQIFCLYCCSNYVNSNLITSNHKI